MVDELILSVLDDIEPLMQAAFDAVDGSPTPGSSLDQLNLLDGRDVVVHYLNHNEARLALDHVVYMIVEPPLAISAETEERLARAGDALAAPTSTIERAMPIITVDDAFEITGRPGLTLTPEVERELDPGDYRALARRPDGTMLPVTATLAWAHFNPDGFRLVCRVPDATKADIPPGSRLMLAPRN